jgi:L-serine/L-threonine ammonia-lyase
MLVELACSTALIPAYHPTLLNKMVPQKSEPRCLVFIVCGGFKVSINDATEFQTLLDEDPKTPGLFWQVCCPDGELFEVPKTNN